MPYPAKNSYKQAESALCQNDEMFGFLEVVREQIFVNLKVVLVQNHVATPEPLVIVRGEPTQLIFNQS